MAELYQRIIVAFVSLLIGLIVNVISIQINQALNQPVYIISIPVGLGLLGFFYEELGEFSKSVGKINLK